MCKIDPLLNLISPYSFLLSVMGHFFFFSIFPQTFIYFFEYHLLIEVLVELQCCVTFRYIFIQIVFPYRSLHKILNIVPCAIQ